ncbi:hypothetical protein BU23DRAFT_550234 [Bimuria novae-zelandiae CBS 107.79]|uniref:Uncharacterized protein n=1 Tax=Bimuria novae-zelandiae CBS 107.79 TaxID=1447943 RepID=A0A6A5VR38_9PLEO|nr:hypothetical protein BU23DRAFT_550234 [Bimuria novae-zelandiae CBS 107.79]
MTRPKPFHAAIQVPAVLSGRIVTDRVACCRRTRVLEEKLKDRYGSTRKLQYQRRIANVLLAACRLLHNDGFRVSFSGRFRIGDICMFFTTLGEEGASLWGQIGMTKNPAFQEIFPEPSAPSTTRAHLVYDGRAATSSARANHKPACLKQRLHDAWRKESASCGW